MRDTNKEPKIPFFSVGVFLRLKVGSNVGSDMGGCPDNYQERVVVATLWWLVDS